MKFNDRLCYFVINEVDFQWNFEKLKNLKFKKFRENIEQIEKKIFFHKILNVFAKEVGNS